jgi:O-antigen/teichoic acid export membrane protein
MIRLFSHGLVRYMPSQLGGLLAFLTVPILTRLLSVEEYGLYTLLLSSITILVTLMNGLGPAIVRFYPAVSEDEVDAWYGRRGGRRSSLGRRWRSPPSW